MDDLFRSGKRVIFTMGKGGVGKTTLATEIALGLSSRGAKVHLTTTDRQTPELRSCHKGRALCESH